MAELETLEQNPLRTERTRSSKKGESYSHLPDLVQETRNAIEASDTDPGWTESRYRWDEDMRFLDDDQWPAAVKEARENEGRPTLVINKVRKYVQAIVGNWRENKTSIKVRPASGDASKETARVFEGLIRTIEHDSCAESVYQDSLEQGTGGGFAWWRVNVEWELADGWRPCCRIRHITNPLSVYLDPLCRRHDLSDASYVAATEWITRQEFRRKFGEDKAATDIDWSTGDGYKFAWTEESLDLVRIAEYWWREPKKRHVGRIRDDLGGIRDYDLTGYDREFINTLQQSGQLVEDFKVQDWEIRYGLVSGSDVLYGPKVWPGRWFPFVPVWGERTIIDSAMYLRSLVRGARDSQRMYNIWRSYVAEILALQPKVPWVGPSGFVGTGENKQRWEESHKASIPYLEYEGQIPPERPRPPDWPSGMNSESLQNTQDLKETTGMFDASIGAQSNETSGKAILYRTKQGATTTSRFPEGLRLAIQHTGTVLIDLIPYVYDQPRVAKILAEDQRTIEVVSLNGAILPDLERGGNMPTHKLGIGRYAVVSTVGPHFPTQRLEAFDALMTMGEKLGPQGFAKIADLVVGQADWPGAEALAERLAQANLQAPVSPEVLKQLLPILQQEAQKAASQAVPPPQAIEELILQIVNKVHEQMGLPPAKGGFTKPGGSAASPSAPQPSGSPPPGGPPRPIAPPRQPMPPPPMLPPGRP